MLDDFSYSSFTIDGKFTFHSAFQLLNSKFNGAKDISWIWKLHCALIINFFTWLAMLDRHSTCKILYKRGITSSETCALRPGVIEDAEDVLRSCIRAKAFWSLTFHNANPSFFLFHVHLIQPMVQFKLMTSLIQPKFKCIA